MNAHKGIAYLRIFATIAVIWLHTAGTLTVLAAPMEIQGSELAFYNWAMRIMTWSVPVFFMLTGALLLKPEKEITVKQLLKKYILRTLLALFIFGIPFALLILVFNGEALTPMLLLKSIAAVITGESFSHLWYLYVLLGIYLILPVLKIFTKHASPGDKQLVLLSLFLLSFALPHLSGILKLDIEFSVPFAYPVFYLLMGHYIITEKPRLLSNIKADAIIFVILWMPLVTISGIMPQLPISTENDSPFTAISATLIFSCFVLAKPFNEAPASALLWKADRLCFGAYLIHPLFIQFSYRFLEFSPSSFELYPLLFIPFFIAFVLLSFFASWIMSFIKPLKKYVL